MKRLYTNTLAIFAVTTLAGACLHFLHALAPNFLTALFSPVNESIWEHVKILYWPLLVAALVLTRGGEKGSRGPWALGILISILCMLLVGGLYHLVMGGESLAADIVLYVVMMALCFVLANGALDRPGVRGKSELLVLLLLALGCAIVLFTFLPPDLPLFTDFSGANTWARIPC